MVQKLGKVQGPTLGPWGWLLLLAGAGVLGFMLLTGTGIGAFSFLQAGTAHERDLFRRTVAYAKQDAELQEALGEPIEADNSGARDRNDDEDIVRLEIPLSGPRATAELVIEVRKNLGPWELLRFHATVDNGDVIRPAPPIWVQSE